MSEQTITHSCGAKSSACPRLDLIPYGALLRLAERYEKGLERYGRGNWRTGLTNRDYVLERAAHGLNHLLRVIGKIEGTLPDDGDDDAAALMWCGAFLCEATAALANQKNCHACGGTGKCEGFNHCPACKGTGKLS